MQKFRLSDLWLILLLVVVCNIKPAHSAPKMVSAKPKTILVLGDSLSAEYGLERGKGWVSLLEQRLQEKNFNVRIINASISGDTTSGGAHRIDALLKKHQPTTVIVELGANDGLRGLPVASAKENILAIIADIKAAKASVLLIGMQIPPNYGHDYTHQFASMYPQIARQKKVALVPFFLEGVADKAELFQADQLHLTAAAHPLILNNVWPHLLPLISK